MGRRKRVKNVEGSLPKNYDFKPGGSGPEECPIGDHGGIGKAGNQNTPGIEHVDLKPSDAGKFDKNFGHKVK